MLNSLASNSILNNHKILLKLATAATDHKPKYLEVVKLYQLYYQKKCVTAVINFSN
jgi:hypothetical protein